MELPSYSEEAIIKPILFPFLLHLLTLCCWHKQIMLLHLKSAGYKTPFIELEADSHSVSPTHTLRSPVLQQTFLTTNNFFTSRNLTYLLQLRNYALHHHLGRGYRSSKLIFPRQSSPRPCSKRHNMPDWESRSRRLVSLHV